jgi:hypothetical protein
MVGSPCPVEVKVEMRERAVEILGLMAAARLNHA